MKVTAIGPPKGSAGAPLLSRKEALPIQGNGESVSGRASCGRSDVEVATVPCEGRLRSLLAGDVVPHTAKTERAPRYAPLVARRRRVLLVAFITMIRRR